jgi:hypothetical protein
MSVHGSMISKSRCSRSRRCVDNQASWWLGWNDGQPRSGDTGYELTIWVDPQTRLPVNLACLGRGEVESHLEHAIEFRTPG